TPPPGDRRRRGSRTRRGSSRTPGSCRDGGAAWRAGTDRPGDRASFLPAPPLALRGRNGVARIGDERSVGEALQEFDEIRPGPIVQVEPPDEIALARTVAAVAGERAVRYQPAAARVVIDRLRQGRD